MDPNVDLTESRTASVEAECLFFIIALIVTSVLRVYARTQSKAGLWWDDYLSFVASIFVIGINCLGYAEARHGLGKHVGVVGASGALFYLKSLYADGLIYNACLTLGKLSVLCFYKRIFATTATARTVLWITAGVTIAWCISVVLVCALECMPVKAAWDPTTPAKCINFLQFYYGSAGSSIVLDFALLIIPVPFLWRLHMDWTHKLALTTTFLLGYLNPIVSFVRLAYLIQLGPEIKSPDITWNYVDLTAWSIAECSVALISAHIPALQFLFSRLVRKAKQTTINTARNGTQIDGDEAELVVNRPNRPDGRFQRLNDARYALGFKEMPDQYGASAYSKKESKRDTEYELELASRIHVSKRIDVFSSQYDSNGKPEIEHV